MIKIKFSKEYPKLHKQTEAILLNVKGINYNGLTDELIGYDTKAEDGSYYPLPKTELIHLTFLGNKLIPFCTIRRYTNKKYDYYQNNKGKVFILERTFKEDTMRG